MNHFMKNDDRNGSKRSRGNALGNRKRPWQHLYNDGRWLRLRSGQLERQPLCERCLQDGVITVATIVHHVVAHKGNETLFFDGTNLASSCKRCHDSTEQSIERRGYDRSVSDDGWPQDANHPFNRKVK